MPILIILLLAILIAQFGFWDTLAGVLRGIGIILLVGITLVALLGLIGLFLVRKLRSR